ncbi:hypothetical protein AB849_011320 [Thermoactinomyces vulgaris]|nr:hypothetical protein [Thermoactinomyces vulgaris]QBK14133.1 hypothetical protein AB849_011320 [Thermoactinomyces vulgaris]
MTNLDSNTPVKLKMRAYDQSNSIIDEIRIETSTLRSEKDKQDLEDNRLKNSHLITIIRKNQINLNWSGIPDDDNTYEIYKEGTLIDTVKGNEYIDKNPDVKKSEVTYQIVGKKKMSEAEIEKAKKIAKENHIFIPKSKENEIFTETATLTKRVTMKESENNLANDKNVSSNYMGYGYLFRYQTFIPLSKAPNPSGTRITKGYKSFAGDNKYKPEWWGDEGGKYRTRVDVLARFDTSPAKAYFGTRHANLTVAYNKYGSVAGVARASMDKVYFYKRQSGSDSGGRYVQFGYIHQVGNPLANPGPDIDYQYSAKVYENGVFTAVGYQDRAPSHELWMVNIQGDNDIRVHYSKHEGFDCLIPGLCATKSWSYSY